MTPWMTLAAPIQICSQKQQHSLVFEVASVWKAAPKCRKGDDSMSAAQCACNVGTSFLRLELKGCQNIFMHNTNSKSEFQEKALKS
eukprot:1149816-Pelagomonas_calceolata.AAC.8